ncbi:MAG: hypothetical protein ABSF78_00100 [Candidatus Acidiferrales bacterium]|jgi:NAD(P)-dependent dehydrogenase (short-subunit alcohol dehydrogenase family)
MKKVLITGSGTGFGHEAAMRLAEKGFDVIATVEIWAQVQPYRSSQVSTIAASRRGGVGKTILPRDYSTT